MHLAIYLQAVIAVVLTNGTGLSNDRLSRQRHAAMANRLPCTPDKNSASGPFF
jgi:hypothetical protein